MALPNTRAHAKSMSSMSSGETLRSMKEDAAANPVDCIIFSLDQSFISVHYTAIGMSPCPQEHTLRENVVLIVDESVFLHPYLIDPESMKQTKNFDEFCCHVDIFLSLRHPT